jgi:hypothetical protein
VGADKGIFGPFLSLLFLTCSWLVLGLFLACSELALGWELIDWGVFGTGVISFSSNHPSGTEALQT